MLHLTIAKKSLIRNFTCLLALSLLYNPAALSSNIRRMQTTRLHSTAGTGVGSLMLNESSVLNPAPLGLMNSSAVYFQKSNSDITFREEAVADNNKNLPQSDQMLAIATDAKGSLKGALSYQKSKDGYNYRKRFGISSAKSFNKKSSFGATYFNTTDDLSEDGYRYKTDKYHQTSFGIIHKIEDNFTIGLTAMDPFRVKPNESRTIAGFDYMYKNIVSLMGDIGSDYDDLSEGLLYRGALQLKVLNDFFVRAGMFRDKKLKERGNGAGIGWVTPKLVFEVAYQSSSLDDFPEIEQVGTDIKETSFSLYYHW
jgi:hypothetical protein